MHLRLLLQMVQVRSSPMRAASLPQRLLHSAPDIASKLIGANICPIERNRRCFEQRDTCPSPQQSVAAIHGSGLIASSECPLISTRNPKAVCYPQCLHEQLVFAGTGSKWNDFSVAVKASREVISPPMHPFLSETDQDLVVSAVNRALPQPASIE